MGGRWCVAGRRKGERQRDVDERYEMEDSREQRIDRLAKMEEQQKTRRRREDRVQRAEPC